MIRAFGFSIVILLSVELSAQQPTEKKVLKLIEKSDEKVADRQFEKARDLLTQALDEDPSFAGAYEKMFIVLKILGKDSEIHRLQLQYIQKVPDPYKDSRVWQSLASYEFAKGNYQEAREFIIKADRVDSTLYKSIEFSLFEITSPDTLTVSELTSKVNKLDYQYLPVLTVDKSTLIYTGRNEGSDEDILISYKANGEWSEATSISDRINTDFNEGACSVSADGRTLIFTACEGRGTFGNCDLYVSHKTGNEWSDYKNLGRTVNSRFWDSQPSISADGKTLYFVSNRPGGIGGRDIWMSRLENGLWQEPENVGKPVNTPRDETTPFIHANSKSLFFSSNGHVGMGGFDLYKISIYSKGWGEIENLGYPINSHNDEVSLFLSSDGADGYFAKEEKNGSKVTSSRLVNYKVPNRLRESEEVSYLTGTVRDSKTRTPLGASIELVDLESRRIAYKTTSDDRTGHYFMVLPASNQFGVFVEKEQYMFDELSLESAALGKSDTIDFFLKPIEPGAKMILRNIYFQFDSDQLDEKSFEELDRVVRWLGLNPTISIKIAGHTDNAGSNKYNIDLSERRAKRVFDYLVTKKIDALRMDYKGYGSFYPLNENQNEVEKSKNRRIEFEISSDL